MPSFIHSFTRSFATYYGRMPFVVSGAVRRDPLRFLAGCHKRRLNQAPSVLSLSLIFFLIVSLVLLTRAPFALCYLCVLSLGCSG